MQITKIKSKFTSKRNGVDTGPISPDRIFSISNEEMLVIIGGRIVHINRDKDKEAILLGANQPINCYYFYDQKLYVNPSHVNRIYMRMYAIFDVKNGRINNIYNEPVGQNGDLRPHFLIIPDFENEIMFKVVFQNHYGQWHHQSCYYNAVENWNNPNMRIWNDATMLINERYLFIDYYNKKYYGVCNTEGAMYKIENIITHQSIGSPIHGFVPNCFAVFHNKPVFGMQNGLYTDYRIYEGKYGVVNYHKRINRLKISPDNQFLVFSSFNQLVFLDSELREYKTFKLPEEIIDFDYSPDRLTMNVLTHENVITMDME